MLADSELEEIREHLERAQNPVFFYDNDVDGLCSFLLLRRYLGRGKGVAVRTAPEIDKNYARKVAEFKADYVFALDKPFLGRGFLDEISSFSIPVVWIDHHDVNVDYEYENLHIFNPTKNKIKSSEPVTYMCQKIAGRKEDLWIALIGCVSDHYMPDFAHKFAGEFPEFWSREVRKDEPFDVYYKTQIGLVARALAFGLKDSVSNVVYMQNFLISCGSPQDVLLELEAKNSFAKKYVEMKRKYNSLIGKAKSVEPAGRVLFFKYAGELSISSELANELSYLYPDKAIIVAYEKGSVCNVSVRGEGVGGVLARVLENFAGASGGGHENAAGARVKTEDLERFKNEFEREIDKKHGK